MSVSRSATLQLRRPFGQTLALAVLILALIAGMAEAGARLFLKDSNLPRAIGSANTTIDVKFGALDRLTTQQGGIDCLFLGSSVVLNGLDPAPFAAAYAAQTGAPLTCYNFGVPALTASSAGVLAQVLVERYQPRLLIYGLTARAIATDVPDSRRVYAEITGTPWIAYRTGSAQPVGWLVEHSLALRQALGVRNWMRADYPQQRQAFRQALAGGYQPFLKTRDFVPQALTVPRYFAPLVIAPHEWAGLQRVLAQASHTTVLVIEMPLPEVMLRLFEGGPAAYAAVWEQIGGAAAARDVQIWQTSALGLIPDDGWAEDGHHVNATGAAILSAWLGEQVGRAVVAGTLAVPGV